MIKKIKKILQNKKSYASETSKCRLRLSPYCIGYGVDLGFGGDPINDSAIRIDQVSPYARTGGDSIQLGGDARNLKWFNDEVLDYVYSSHLLEDFEDTKSILKEWLRVLKKGGNLIIYCPDEQKYRLHCKKTGQIYNDNHKHADFSLSKIKLILEEMRLTEIIHENPLVEDYSWEIVCKKI